LKVCIVRDGRRALTREEGLLGTRPACVWAAVHATVSLIKTFLSLSLSFPFFSTVKRGDRVAQLILERIVTPEVEEVDDLDDTARGAGGYGSTGVASK